MNTAPPKPPRGLAAMSSIQPALARSVLDNPSTFKGRGLSDRTVKALVDCSIDAPERLLFLDDQALKSIPGVGKVGLAEILAYRSRFLPET